MDMKLRMPYEKVTKEYNDSYSAILLQWRTGMNFANVVWISSRYTKES